MGKFEDYMEKNEVSTEDVEKWLEHKQSKEKEAAAAKKKKAAEAKAKKEAKKEKDGEKEKEKESGDKKKKEEEEELDIEGQMDVLIEEKVNERVKEILKTKRGDAPKGKKVDRGDKEYPTFGKHGISV